MDVTRKKEILTYLNTLSSQFDSAVASVPELLQPLAENWQSSLDTIATNVEQCSLFVPVVGGFSTGKSTALNALLGRDVLPEKVSPETAIPAELHFSDEERIMALGQNGSWSVHALNELAALSLEAKNYQVVRIYLNSPVLKQIEPLVLVDMPGFDSGLDQHNEAILRYITTGALYLYLVDCKSGTIGRQDSRRIEEIIDLGRSVKVFLTKTDLASEVEVKATQDYVSDQLSTIADGSQVGLINKDDVGLLLAELTSVDVPSLFDGMALPQVKNLYFDADGLVNTAMSALNSDAKSVAKKVEDAERALLQVETEKTRLLADAKAGGVTQKCDLVMSRLEQMLRSSTDELAAQAKVSESALSKGVADLVRATLTVEIQTLVRKSTSDIAYQFSGEINLGGLSLSSNNDWMDNLISVIESEAMNALTGAQDRIYKSKNADDQHSDDDSFAKKAISAISGLAIMIPTPVLRAVFAILPGIIGQLFGNFKNNIETEKYRQVITSQVIPAVLSQVRPQVMESLNAVEGEIIRAVSEQISEKVSNQKSLYDDVAQRSEEEIQTLRNKQGDLESIKNKMSESANGVFPNVC